MNKCPHFDLVNPNSYSNGVPFDDLATLRIHCPVSKQHDSVLDEDFWAITRKEDIDFISTNPAIFSSEAELAINEDLDAGQKDALRMQIINMDPPKHLRYRNIVRAAFTPRAVAVYEARFREVAKEIVDKVASKGECEFVSEVAAALPLIAICELMGIAQEDRHLMYDWVHTTTTDPDATEEERTLCAMQVFEYATKLAQQHRSNPQPGSIIATLLDGVVEEEGLTDEEFCWFFLILIVGGIETTRTMTSHGMRLLMEHPDQLQQLVDDPGLIEEAIEEMLRYNPPFIMMRRTAMEDIELSGQHIKQGDKILMFYHAANRDKDLFGADADDFDITRAQRVDLARTHRAFGFGEHFCLGNRLARLELKIVFSELLPRLRNPRLAGEVEYLKSSFINGITAMPIQFDAE
ncbi:MAG: cytochrome P450 [Gammaproteobacteria bacterium]|nr:cytochrome P450 [Gammaproteobacteria bacterium]